MVCAGDKLRCCYHPDLNSNENRLHSLLSGFSATPLVLSLEWPGTRYKSYTNGS